MMKKNFAIAAILAIAILFAYNDATAKRPLKQNPYKTNTVSKVNVSKSMEGNPWRSASLSKNNIAPRATKEMMNKPSKVSHKISVNKPIKQQKVTPIKKVRHHRIKSK